MCMEFISSLTQQVFIEYLPMSDIMLDAGDADMLFPCQRIHKVTGSMNNAQIRGNVWGETVINQHGLETTEPCD